jgi:uncharacterized DUF497 family protein
MASMNYTWDEDKSEQVLGDHKIEFVCLLDIFSDPYAVDFIDEMHSTETETRYAIIGLTAHYGLVFLTYT